MLVITVINFSSSLEVSSDNAKRISRVIFSYGSSRGLPKGKAALGPFVVNTGSSYMLVFCSVSLVQVLLLDVKQSFLDIFLRDEMSADQSDCGCFRPRIELCSQNSGSFMH